MQDKRNEALVEEILQDFNKISGDRGNWESHWQEIAERIMPLDSNQFMSREGTQGDKRNLEIFDSTAAIALERFAAVMDSLLTPANETWHGLEVSDPVLMKDRATRLYFEEANRLLFRYRYAASANFSGQNFQRNLSLGAYGTGTLFTDEMQSGTGTRYKCIHLAQIYFRENHQGIVDEADRRIDLTGKQLYQMFPKISRDLQDKIRGNADKKWTVVHAVRPNKDLDPTRWDYRGMPYKSCYVLKDEKALLEEKGYGSFPYSISRYKQGAGEVYGRSPAMDVLPAIKTLNEQKKTLLKQGQRAVDPILLMHDDGVLDGFSLKPGAQNYGGVSADGKVLVHTLPTGNVQVGKEMMDDERAVIKDAFLTTMFQILMENPQQTATEVLERVKERSILLTPVLGRQQTESLEPMIVRELDILNRQGVLPPMPPLLKEAKGEYQIKYSSPLNLEQRSKEASGFMRTLQTAIEVAQATQNPAILDHFKFDNALPAIAQIQGVPLDWMSTKEDLQQLRQGRAEDQQKEQAIQAAPAAAAMIKAKAVAQGK